MRYCALMGDIEWYEDSLKKDLQKVIYNTVEKYGRVTFLVPPMCVYNGRVSEIIEKTKNQYPDTEFVFCTRYYNEDYISPGAPFESILIPADINKVEDFYPYLCKWIIQKCETAIIYIDRKSLQKRNHLSVNALKLAEYARSLEKEVITVQIEFDYEEYVAELEKEKNQNKDDIEYPKDIFVTTDN